MAGDAEGGGCSARRLPEARWFPGSRFKLPAMQTMEGGGMREVRVSAAKWPMSSALYQAAQFPIPFVRSVSESRESTTHVGSKKNEIKPS